MSWNTYVYAEVKHESSDQWLPLTDRCLCENFKYYDDYFCACMDSIHTEDVVHPEAKSYLENNNYSSVKSCGLEAFRSHYEDALKAFQFKLKSVYSALGVPLFMDEDECYVQDADFESETFDKREAWWQYMTFPINKLMMGELALSIPAVTKAYQMIGLCNTIISMADYSDKIRLLFVNM